MKNLLIAILKTLWVSSIAHSIGIFAVGGVEVEEKGVETGTESSLTQASQVSTPEQILQQAQAQFSQTSTPIAKEVESSTESKLGSSVSLDRPTEEEQKELERIPLETKTSEKATPARSISSSITEAFSRFFQAVSNIFTRLINTLTSTKVQPKEDSPDLNKYLNAVESLKKDFDGAKEKFEVGQITKDQFIQGTLSSIVQMISYTNDYISQLQRTPDSIRLTRQLMSPIEDLISEARKVDASAQLTSVYPGDSRSIYDALEFAVFSLRPASKQNYTELMSMEFSTSEGRKLPLQPFSNVGASKE